MSRHTKKYKTTRRWAQVVNFSSKLVFIAGVAGVFALLSNWVLAMIVGLLTVGTTIGGFILEEIMYKKSEQQLIEETCKKPIIQEIDFNIENNKNNNIIIDKSIYSSKNNENENTNIL